MNICFARVALRYYLKKQINCLIMTFAFIILHFKNSNVTNRCVESVKTACRTRDKIIIVDASHDVELTDNNGISVIRPKKYNPGFARGMNIGVRSLPDNSCDILAFVNNDAILPPRFSNDIQAAFDAGGDKVAAVGPKIAYLSRPDTIWSGGGKISALKMTSVQINQFKNVDKLKGIIETDFLSGCVFCIKNKIFGQIGQWPEHYLFGGEEWEISKRLRDAGYSLLLAADITALHEADFVRGQGSSHSFHDLRFEVNSYFNRILFANRNYSFLRTLLFRVYLAAYIAFFMPFRRKAVGPRTRFFDKLWLSIRMIPRIVFRSGRRPVTFTELEKVVTQIQ